MWIAIFKSGKHADSSGKVSEWTNEQLDEKIIQRYNEQNPDERHDAPVVLGHPKANSPAYGWVEALKRVGDVVYAKVKDVSAEFIEAWKKGSIKKRSVSLYPDGLLRHVGFVPLPAIKGLPDFQFSDKEFSEYEFESKGIISGLIEDLSMFFESPSAKENKTMENVLEIENQKLKAENEAFKKRENDALRKVKETEFTSFCEKIKLTPAEIPVQVGILIALDESGKTEDLTKHKEFLEARNSAYLEVELQGGKKEKKHEDYCGLPVDDERAKLDAEVREYMDKHENVSYIEAINIILEKE